VAVSPSRDVRTSITVINVDPDSFSRSDRVLGRC
jgi:hypothetical protein